MKELEESKSRKWVIPSIVAVIVIVVVVAVVGISFLGANQEYEIPVADIDVDENVVYASISVHFDASGSYDPDGTIKTHEWDFQDGSTDYGEVVSHAFEDEGTYEVVLTVTDNDDQSISTSVEITVLNDISITITDYGWSLLWPWYFWLDITVTNHGYDQASTGYAWFEVEVVGGGKYSGVDATGSPPNTLGKDDLASWTVYFDIPGDKTPDTLIYDDLDHHTEASI